MKRIAIIGASAGVGFLTVQQALQNGAIVVALSRHLEALADNTNLVKVPGSGTSVADVKRAVVNADAVIIAVGKGSSTKATTLFTDVARTVLEALRELNAQPPLVVLTGFGAGDSGAYQTFPMNLVFRFMLKKVYENKTAMEKILTAGYEKWVIVRPGRLTAKSLTRKYRVFDQVTTGMKIGSISRADVAHYLVEQALNPSMLGHYVSLGK